jgi:hypothetical protein
LQENRDSYGNLPQVTQLRWDKTTTADALSCVTSVDFSQSVASLCWVEGTLAVPSDVVRCKVSLALLPMAEVTPLCQIYSLTMPTCSGAF